MKNSKRKRNRRKGKKFQNRKLIWISTSSNLKRNLRSLRATMLLNPNGREHDFKRREIREKV